MEPVELYRLGVGAVGVMGSSAVDSTRGTWLRLRVKWGAGPGGSGSWRSLEPAGSATVRAMGPMVIGHFYDRAGSYQPRCVVGLGFTTLLAAAISLFLRRDRTPYQASHESLALASISLEE